MHGQLINPSFEMYSSLPDNTGQFSKAIGWSNAGSTLASPDYYHYSANQSADLPVTPMAYVDSYEGNGVMGFCATGTAGTNFREYVSTQFTQPLTPGKTYVLTFRITNGLKTDVSTGGLAASRLGVHFSTSALAQNGTDALTVLPQFRVDSVLYTTAWKQYCYQFTAAQAYTHMTLGVFFQDNAIQILDKAPGNSQYAYYFLDDFHLKEVPANYDPTRPTPSRDDITVERPKPGVSDVSPEPFYVPNSFTPNGDSQNDIFKPVAGSVSEWELNIYTTWGDRIFTSNDPSAGWDGTYNDKSASVGSYVYEVKYRVYEDSQGWQELAHRGTVQLIR